MFGDADDDVSGRRLGCLLVCLAALVTITFIALGILLTGGRS